VNCVASDLVKKNAPDWSAVFSSDLSRDVPRDRFTFAIRIGREQNLAGLFRNILQLGKSFFLAGNRYVFRLETILDVDADFLFGKITDVTDCVANALTASEILADCLCFGR